MGPWLGFIRPFPLLFLWTSVLVGAVVDADLLATSLDSFHLFEVLLLVALLWFNSVMLNDYFDREEDSVNEGDRPLKRIGLKPFRTVYVMSTILQGPSLWESPSGC
jgi:4-hydroxybenzoate polyprenyltransferase